MRITIIIAIAALLAGSMVVSHSNQVMRGFRNTFVCSGWNWIERHSMESDPVFNLADHFDSLKQDIPGQYWKRFEGVRSLNEANQVHSEILMELRDQDIVDHSQGTAYAAYLLGKLLVDLPILIFLIAIPWLWLRTKRHRAIDN